LGLNELAHDARLSTLLFEGVTLQVPPNHSTRTKTKKSILQQQTQNMKHRGTMTNENMTHMKSTKHDT
jgi:hypothetical protein